MVEASEGAAGKAKSAGLGARVRVVDAGSSVVVVLKCRVPESETPRRWTETSAACDGEGAAVDGAPGTFGLGECLGVWGDGTRKPGVVAAVQLESENDGVAVTLLSHLGTEVAA